MNNINNRSNKIIINKSAKIIDKDREPVHDANINK